MSEWIINDHETARRLELCHAWRSVRYAGAYQKLHPEAQTSILEFAGGYAIFVAPGSPLNNACGVGLSGQVTVSDLDCLEEFFTSRGEIPRLHACPLADESLLELLARRGYVIDSFFSALVRPIPAGFTPAPLPEGMRLTVASPEEANRWIEVTARGFDGSDHPARESVDIIGPNFHAEDARPFFAWYGDQPAGGGGLYACPAQRAVELGGASTLVQYRRRGVQHALIEARLAEAISLGCDLALVLTEPGSGSQRNMQRAGFQLAYTKPVVRLPAR